MRLSLFILLPFMLTACYDDANFRLESRIHKPELVKGSPEIKIGNIVVQEASLTRISPEPKARKVKTIVTGYCPCARCCSKMTGKTAFGTNAWKPGIAADWGCFPAGTILRVPGYGSNESRDDGDAIVDDSGGDMRRAWRKGEIHIDVRFVYHWQARQWGRQILEVFIISVPGEKNVDAR